MKNRNIYDEVDKRIECRYSARCGSCQYAGVKYNDELAVKQRRIEELFGKYIAPAEIIGMYRPAYYRNKVHAVVGCDGRGNIVAGAYEQGSHNIVDTQDCLIEDTVCSAILKDLKKLAVSFKYEPYNEDTGRGMIRHFLLRRGFSTREIMLVVVTARSDFPSKNNFLKALLDMHPEITTVVWNINDMQTSMILGRKNVVLSGYVNSLSDTI